LATQGLLRPHLRGLETLALPALRPKVDRSRAAAPDIFGVDAGQGRGW